MKKQSGLIVSIMIIQLIAIVGAILTARFSEKFGNPSGADRSKLYMG